MKVAIYCRVSSDSQKEEKTIEAQKHELPVYAESQGWEIVETYIDEGYSGGFLDGRTEFARLLDDMPRKKFDVVLVWNWSRITRTANLRERGHILESFRENSVKIASPSSGVRDISEDDAELITTFDAWRFAKERKEIALNLREGRKRHLRRGSYAQSLVPFPFRRETDRTKKPHTHKIVVNEDELKTLQTTYNQIVNNGQTIHYTADYLNRLGYKPRKAKKWTPGTLQALLRNKDTLTGNIICNRYNSKMIGQKKFQNLGQRPEDQWIRVPVPVIFTELEYKRLDKRLTENRKQGRPNISGDEFLLKGQKVRCGDCGRVYGPRWTAPKNHKITKYYVCGGRIVQPKFMKEGERKCDSPYVNQEVLDEMVWRDLVLKLFMFPEKTLRNWNKANTIEKGLLKTYLDKLAKLDKEIAKKQENVKRLLDEAMVKAFGYDMILEKKKELDKALETLDDERKRLLSEITKIKLIEGNKEIIKQGKQDFYELAKKLSSQMNNLPMKERQKLIEFFIPNGSHIIIYELNPEDYHFYDLGPGRKIKICWAYRYQGVIDLSGIIQALKAYQKTKSIPEYTNYLSNKDSR